MAKLQRLSFRLPLKALAYSGALLAIGAAVLGGTAWAYGPAVAHAGYLAIMLLLSPARALRPSVRAIAALWAVIVSIAGFLAGEFGEGVPLIGLVVVCLVQGLFRLGEVASLTRSPVNFVVFAGIAQTDTQLWQVALGSVIGAACMLGIAQLMPPKRALPPPSRTAPERIAYGLMLAAGSVLIVLVSDALHFPFASWALLSFCMILAVGADQRRARARDRTIGTIVGAAAAVLVALLPDPAPFVVAVAAMFLCVAYLREGNYTLFVTFLTPAILLTSHPEGSMLALGAGRIEAILLSVVVAVICSAIAQWLGARLRAAGTWEVRRQ